MINWNRIQLEVAPLKSLSFLFWSLTWRIPLDTTKKLKEWEKPSLQYKLIIYKHCLTSSLLIQTLPNMYFTVNLKMKKPMICCCFTWIVFIELNFTVPFLLIRKTWDDWSTGEVGGSGILRNGGHPSNGRMNLK